MAGTHPHFSGPENHHLPNMVKTSLNGGWVVVASAKRNSILIRILIRSVILHWLKPMCPWKPSVFLNKRILSTATKQHKFPNRCVRHYTQWLPRNSCRKCLTHFQIHIHSVYKLYIHMHMYTFRIPLKTLFLSGISQILQSTYQPLTFFSRIRITKSKLKQFEDP